MNIDQSGDAADIHADVRALPFPDRYADRLVAIHVFEHLYPWEALDTLREWRRVLKPGGILTLELPCMDKVFAYIALKLKQQEPFDPTWVSLPIWGDPAYQDPSMLHQWGYCTEDMKKALTVTRFASIINEKPRYHTPHRDMRWCAMKPEDAP